MVKLNPQKGPLPSLGVEGLWKEEAFKKIPQRR